MSARLQPHHSGGQTRMERSEEHTSELQSLTNLVCRLLLEKKKTKIKTKQNQPKKKEQKENEKRTHKRQHQQPNRTPTPNKATDTQQSEHNGQQATQRAIVG